MTFDELGAKLRRIKPQLADIPLDDKQLAQYFLNLYPEYYDLVSPTASRIKEISERSTESTAWFEGSRISNRAGHIANNLAEASALHQMDVLLEASARGVSVAAFDEIVKLDHQAKLQMQVEEHRHKLKLKEYQDTALIDLNAADRSDLSAHHQLDYLDQQLTGLYKRRAALKEQPDDASRDELNLVNRRIKMLEDDFYGRRATLVQAPDAAGLLTESEEAGGSGSGSEASAAATEQASSKKPRVGY